MASVIRNGTELIQSVADLTPRHCEAPAGRPELAEGGSLPPDMHDAWLLPILVYLAVALSYAVPYLIGQDGGVAEAGGESWRAQDLRETTVIVMLFTMLFTAALALSRWAMRRGGAAA